MSVPGATRQVQEVIVEVGDGALVSLVDRLVEVFRAEQDWKTYCRILSKMQGEETAPLLPLVDHPSAEVRRAALRALRGRSGEDLERKLIAVVNASLGKRPVEPRVLWSLDVLEQMETPAAKATLQRLVTHPDPRLRRRALDYMKLRDRRRTRPAQHTGQKRKKEGPSRGSALPPPLPPETSEDS